MENITFPEEAFFYPEQQDKCKKFKNNKREQSLEYECRLNFRFDPVWIYVQVLRINLHTVCL